MNKYPISLLLAGILCTPLAQAQVKPQAQNNPPIDPTKAVDKGIAMPTPLDKFLALTLLVQTKEIDWKGMFKAIEVNVDIDNLSDTKVQIPMLLGARMADGVMAVQAKDAPQLKKVASDIEDLALKIDLPKEDLARSKKITELAEQSKWLQVFAELGFLQQDIMKKLEERADDPRSSLVILSGWLQGTRYTSTLILAHYTNETSNILREPLLIKALEEKATALPVDVKSHAMVEGVVKNLPVLHGHVNVGLNKPISKQHVEEIKAMSDQCIKKIIGK
jgi:hypothetical protein